MEFFHARGDQGRGVQRLRQRLAKVLGDPVHHPPGLAQGDVFDADTQAALQRWQSGVGLQADGVAGPCVLLTLGLAQFPPFDVPLTSGTVARLCPGTRPHNVSRLFPYVQAALRAWGLCSPDMILAALGVIRAQSDGFVPLSERCSHWNTAAGGAPFGLCDQRLDLGNDQPGDGARYKGRGYVQLRGRAHYAQAGERLGIDLVNQPAWANLPEVASCLLAEALHRQREPLAAALASSDWAQALGCVQDSLRGLDRFTRVFELAHTHWPALTAASPAHARATARRPLSARQDAPDWRDRPYAPPPVSLARCWPEPAVVHRLLPRYTRAGLILDQGQEGACTGFGLACVVNQLRWRQAGAPARFESVSPRMLYNMARRHDEVAGEGYDGSSCRGALKGWFHHGVCLESDWPYRTDAVVQPSFGYAERARAHSLGVYCRIDPKAVVDLQVAIQTVGAVYASASTHEGWHAVPRVSEPITHHDDLPPIPFDDASEVTGGHAFALVGFNRRGFVVQNSWGDAWGAGGFAVLAYGDWLRHAMDAWVVGLGVPGVVAGQAETPRRAGGAQAAASVGGRTAWSEAQACEHSIVLGDDGRLSRCLTEDEQTRSLSLQAAGLPDQWFRSPARGPGPKRLVLYCHGGLNREAAGLMRARVMGRYFLGNGCYPLFIVWKTGLLDTLKDLLADWVGHHPAAAGVADWLTDRTDSLIEHTVARTAVRPVWGQMKENAALAFENQRGGALLVQALQQLSRSWGDRLEIHLVGHSAGAIWLGHLIMALARAEATLPTCCPTAVRSVHLLAPACHLAFANQHYASLAGVLERTHLSVLSDDEERHDNVAGVYRKSLLWLVSNALEADLRTPLLGLHPVLEPSRNETSWDGSPATREALLSWQRSADQARLTERVHVVDTPRVMVSVAPLQTIPAAHGSFDNDVQVMSRTLQLITGQAVLPLPVDDLRGF